MKTHLDRPLVVNPQDNRNNNTNKTQPGELPLDQEYRRQDIDHCRRAAHCYHYDRDHHQKPFGPDSRETSQLSETRMEHGFSCTSLGNVEASIEGRPGEERHSHRSHRSHRGHRHRNREGCEARSVSPHQSEAGEGHNENRRARQHRRAAREGEEGRRHRSRGKEGEGGEIVEGEGRRARRHRHGNHDKSKGHCRR